MLLEAQEPYLSSSIINQPNRALASARAADPSVTSRKPATKDSSTAISKAARDSGSALGGISIAPSLARCSETEARNSGETGSLDKLRSRAVLKPWTIVMPRTAIDRSPAVLDTALLTPEATPARCSGTEFITVVVSGATVIAIPKPSTITAGKNVDQYDPPTPGSKNKRYPAPATSGPIPKGSLEP